MLSSNIQKFFAGDENSQRYTLENRKTIGGSKVDFVVNNPIIQIIAHSKELLGLSRTTPKLTKSDFIWPSYRPLKFENFWGHKIRLYKWPLIRKSYASRVEWHQNGLDWMILNKVMTTRILAGNQVHDKKS